MYTALPASSNIDSAQIERWQTVHEGQFFERKSTFEGPRGARRHRNAGSVAWDVVETLSAMANADGGELVLGIENDGEITGVPYEDRRLALIIGAPTDPNYVRPALRARAELVGRAGEYPLLHFTVDWSPEVHSLADGRYLMRINDSSMPFPADQISALKMAKTQGLVELSFPAGATEGDLDADLIARAALRMGEQALTLESFLGKYRLAETRGGALSPSLAGLLLFGKDPTRWHARCGIEFIRWEGTERGHGSEFNLSKRLRIEAPLVNLIEQAHEAIRPFIRERQQLHDLFFTERLEYPTSVWQEALVNAVAHRDYSIQGAAIEVSMFDDRMEVHSPGLPPLPVTIEGLNRRQHLHVSRNPVIMRVLAGFGYVRELGEGIPRMFAEMEREGFYPPRFDSIAGVTFTVTLRNEPVYSRQTLSWLQAFGELKLSGDQKRLLAYANAHGNRFTSRDYQKLTGLDIYGASSSIKELIRKGAARSTAKGSRIYEVVSPADLTVTVPLAVAALLPVLAAGGAVTNHDIRQSLQTSRVSATRIANDLCRAGWLQRQGSGRWTRYLLTPEAMNQLRNVSVEAEGDS